MHGTGNILLDAFSQEIDIHLIDTQILFKCGWQTSLKTHFCEYSADPIRFPRFCFISKLGSVWNQNGNISYNMFSTITISFPLKEINEKSFKISFAIIIMKEILFKFFCLFSQQFNLIVLLNSMRDKVKNIVNTPLRIK